MPGHLDAFAEEYRVLHDVARAFGLRREAGLIAARAAGLEHPFMLYILGGLGSGMPAIINLLAGRAVAWTDTSAPWINEYRPSHGLLEHVAVYRPIEGEKPDVLPLQHIGSFLQENSAPIERLVWHVQAPELPDQVSLVQLPEHFSPSDGARIAWQADALLWVGSIHEQELGNADALFTAIQGQRVSPLPSLGVLTGMEVHPRAEWGAIIQETRERINIQVDRLIPYGTQRSSAADGRPDLTTPPVLREVRNRFFRGSSSIRRRDHGQFLETMRHAVRLRFESFVDSSLAARWSNLKFKRDAEVRIHQTTKQLSEEAQRVVGVAFDSSSDPGTASIPDFLEKARLTYDNLFSETAGSLKDHSRYPRLVAEEDLEIPDSPVLPPYGPLDSTDKESVLTRIGGWLRRAASVVQHALSSLADSLFRKRFGFESEQAAETLERLEGQYMRLVGRSLRVPTPYDQTGGMSPAQFLCRMQEESFVHGWNRAVQGNLHTQVLPQLLKRMREQLNRIREMQLTEVDRSRDALRKQLQTIWKAQQKKGVLNDTAVWSLSWALSVLPFKLREPSEFLSTLARTRSGNTPKPLFLSEDHDRFLAGDAAEEDGLQTPEQLAVTGLRLILQEQAVKLWKEDKALSVDVGLRRKVRSRIIGTAIVLAAITVGWIASFGASMMSITLLPVALAVTTGTAWHLIERSMEAASEAAVRKQTDQLLKAMRAAINERMERLDEILSETVNGTAFRAELDNLLQERQAETRPNYLPYSELLKRVA